MRYLATTVPGLEDLAAMEIERFGGKIEDILRGKVIYSATEDVVGKMESNSRFLEINVKVIGEGEIRDPGSVHGILESGIKFASVRIFAKNPPFPRRTLEEELSRYTGGKKGVVYAWVSGDRIIIGKRKDERRLNERSYRVFRHPASLNPIIANAMLLISQFNGDMVDPFCGSGTIPIEAYLLTNRDRGRRGSIYCVDINKKYILGAKANAERAGAEIEIMQGDAINLHRYVDEVDHIITNPPFGLRVGDKRKVFQLYEKFALELENHFSGCSLTVITPHSKFENYFHVELCRDVEYGELKAKICKMKV